MCVTMPRRDASSCRPTFDIRFRQARCINLKLSSKLPALSRLLLILFALCCTTSSQQTRGRETPQPGALALEVESRGASEVVVRLNSGGGRDWARVTRQIETGSAAWLHVADKLLDATDASRTGDLYFALSVALTHNAAGVLSMVGPKLPVEKVCSVPYIEPSPAVIRAYQSKARLALARVTSAELEPRKKACLSSVKTE